MYILMFSARFQSVIVFRFSLTYFDFVLGDFINNVINWAGLLTACPLNFIIPCMVFANILALSVDPWPGAITKTLF